MPTNTFINLSEDKKQRIFDAAVKEFSAKDFKDASINQMIKNADIPKGSFYQYFSGKEDIFLYMIKRIEIEKHEVTKQVDSNHDADVFDIMMQKMKVSFEWAKLRPDYAQIGYRMWNDNSEFIMNFRATTIEWVKKYIEHDKERGLIRSDAKSNLIADMLITLILNESFFAGLEEEKYFEKLEGVIKILKDGVATSN